MTSSRTPMGDVKKETVSTERRLKLWFFRETTSEQRLKLFSIWGLPVEEIGDTHGHQQLALKQVIAALRQPDTRMEGGGEPVGSIYGEFTPISINTSSPNPEHVEGDVVSVGELEVVGTKHTALDGSEVLFSKGHVPGLLGFTSVALADHAAAQSSIQRAERERDEAIDRAKVWEHYWQQEVKVKGEVISWCKDYQTRIAALEAQIEEAMKVLEPFAAVAGEYSDQEDDSHEVWKDAGPEKIIQGSFELRNFRAARSLHASLGEKQDAE